ncbi:MAG: squalene synthase HpnC [Alphaproteobacteria bacterium]|jgi:squalene synthase HpnC|nr:squalene synthase HpnC [Alphaproteobacteria bacterium]
MSAMRQTARTDEGGAAAGDGIAGDGPVARKASTEENFPVASLLLPAGLRPQVMAFYAFVRLADDIADDPDLDCEAKLARLDAFEAALDAGEGEGDWRAPAAVLRQSLDASGVPDRFARDLLRAFRSDARNAPCRDWDDLIDYCRYSAMPVGRFLMALHGEDEGPGAASDALCTALQILNHLQDCGDDWRQLQRLYVPLSWLQEEGLEADALLASSASPALRRVLDRALAGVDELLAEARPLGRLMRNRRLGLESAVIVNLAVALRGELDRRDPLAERVELSKPKRLWVGLGGIVQGLLRR